MSMNGQVCNRLAPNGANHCQLPAGHMSPHRSGLLKTAWVDEPDGPVWFYGLPTTSIATQAVIDGKGDGTPHPKADPDHKHNYLKRTEAARNAADGEHGYESAMSKVAAAFGYESSITMFGDIAWRKKASSGG